MIQRIRGTQSGRRDEGASSVEYALLAAAVAALVAIVVFAFGTLVLDLHSDNCATIRDSVAPGASCT